MYYNEPFNTVIVLVEQIRNEFEQQSKILTDINMLLQSQNDIDISGSNSWQTIPERINKLIASREDAINLSLKYQEAITELRSLLEINNKAILELTKYTKHEIDCNLYNMTLSGSLYKPICTCGLREIIKSLHE